MGPSTPISRAGIAVGLGLVLIGAVIAGDTVTMRIPSSYSRVGPQAFPIFVSAGLIIAGAYIVWTSWARGWQRPLLSEGSPTDWGALLLISAGLIVHFTFLKIAGFVPMAFVLFMMVAFAFGSRHYLRDAIVAIVLALVSYLGFTRGLGLQLPPGLLAGVI